MAPAGGICAPQGTCSSLRFGGLYFLKVFYHLKILEWTSVFRAIDNLPSAHRDETEFSVAFLFAFSI